MTGHVIDTDWAIDYLHGNRKATAALQMLPRGSAFLSAVSVGELYEGAFGSRDPAASLAGISDFLARVVVLPVDENVARVFGEQRARLRRQGQLIDNMDLFIAATCLLHGHRLLTDNIAHFGRIEGLRLGLEEANHDGHGEG